MHFSLRFVLFFLCIINTPVDIFAQASKQKVENWNTKQPSRFTENKGQVTDQEGNLRNDVKFIYSAAGFKAVFKDNSFSYEIFTVEKKPKPISEATGKPINELLPDKFKQPEDVTIKSHRIDIELPGANKHPEIIADGKSLNYNNYYLAHTPEEGVQKVYGFTKLTYKNIWPNIDIVFYAKKEGELKYDIVVHPGGDIEDIKFSYNGATQIELNKGNLSLQTTLGTLEERIPISYFKENNQKVNINYFQQYNAINFCGNYDESKTLVIDPVLAWATYYGDSLEDIVYDISVDDSGNIYSVGRSQNNSSIATSGSFQDTFGGSTDAILLKLDNNSNLKWCTYIGGKDYDIALSSAIDSSSNVYISGYIGNKNFATNGAHQTSYGMGYLAKFSPAGKRLWATYYGEEYAETWAYAVTTDKYKNVYLAGYTSSATLIATSGTYKSKMISRANDAFIAKFDSSGRRIWGTYFGGYDDDWCYSAVTDLSGNIIIAGNTWSTSDIASIGSYQNRHGGNYDAYLAKFDSSGQVLWSTYYGGSDADFSNVNNLATDFDENIYLYGATYSTADIATYYAYQTSILGGSDAFIVKFNSSGSRVWATYFGGNNGDGAGGIIIDDSGYVFISGNTTSTTKIATTGAYKSVMAYNDPQDGFLAKFSSSGARVWSTYFGGSSGEIVQAITADKIGNIYFAGYTYSTNGISTANSYQPNNEGWIDGFIVKFNYSSPDAGIFSIDSISETYCDSLSKKLFVKVKNYSFDKDLKKFYIVYSINDDSAKSITIDSTISVNDTSASIYIDSVKFKTGSNIIKIWTYKPNNGFDINLTNDTLTRKVIIYNHPTANFNFKNECKTNEVIFFDNSTSSDSIKTHTWYFGDGDTSSLRNPTHKYKSDGKYKVTLITTTVNGCVDSNSDSITIFPLPNAEFKVNNLCISEEATFTSNSLLAIEWLWDFGDNTTSISENPTHKYFSAGTYMVKLKVKSINGCEDSISKQIEIYEMPEAVFSVNNICVGESFILTDSSKGATNLFWDFGDSTTSTLESPTHKYEKAGTYTIYLTSTNANGCSDTLSKQIEVYEKPEAIFTVSDICITDSLQLVQTSKGALNYLWNFGDNSTSTQQNPRHKYFSAGTYIVKLVVSNSIGCKDSMSRTVIVDSTCVWPGDANADKIVDNKDILAIGLAYADTGSRRTDTSTVWKGNMLKNWNKNFTSNANYKHADSDGNGIVNNNDTNAVTRNYTKTHAKNQSANRGKNTDPVLKINIQNDSLKAGDTLLAYIILGESTLPAIDVYGLAFRLNYNHDYFYAPEVDFSGSWLGNNIIGYKNTSNGLDIAITRTDKKNVAGYGNIAELKMVLKKDAIFSSKFLKLEIVDNILISAKEEDIPVQLETDSVKTYKEGNGVFSRLNIREQEFKIYPNPFDHQASIEYELQEPDNVNIVLFDINGRSQTVMPSTLLQTGNHVFMLNSEKHKISSGVYLIKLEIDGIPTLKRIIRLK